MVEDDPTTREALARAMRQESYEVEAVARGDSASRSLKATPWSAVILDLGLPDGSGLEWCRTWRKRGHVAPILILTARGDVGSRVEGLDAGADDYLGKPFALSELKARVRALLRRAGEGASARVLVTGNVRVDFGRRKTTLGDEEVPITRREYDVLERLAAAKGRVVLKTDLLEEFWGEATPEHAASLEVIVTRLRRKLDRGSAESLIRTLRGSGYALQTPDAR
ncbi:MAG: response regulator transcription factor [Vicinamibacteria bacterium]